jgi:pyruvate dehydrogenase complex dehydrogenase (E1) component
MVILCVAYDVAAAIQSDTAPASLSIMALLVRDKQLGPKVVPIIPDEARTFGTNRQLRNPWLACHLLPKLSHPHAENQI